MNEVEMPIPLWTDPNEKHSDHAEEQQQRRRLLETALLDRQWLPLSLGSPFGAASKAIEERFLDLVLR